MVRKEKKKKKERKEKRNLKEINALGVVNEINLRPRDVLLLVLSLLELEYVVGEELLELLVGVVDTKLLKAVDLEKLKTKDIQDTNEVHGLLGGFDRDVDVIHNPVKEAGVKCLSHGVAAVLGLER